MLVLLDPNTVDLMISTNKKIKNKFCIHLLETESKNTFYNKLLSVCGGLAKNTYRYHSIPSGGMQRSRLNSVALPAEGDLFRGGAQPDPNTDTETYFKCVDEILYDRNIKKLEIEESFLNMLKKKTIV
jgi:hypothetical protein